MDEKNRGYALGAADYLTKPIDRDELVAACSAASAAHGGRVLLVEDDEMIRGGMPPGAGSRPAGHVRGGERPRALERIAARPARLSSFWT